MTRACERTWAAVVLAMSLAAGSSAGAADAVDLAAAQAEGKVVIYGSWPRDGMAAAIEAFTAKTGIEVEFTNIPSSQVIQRFLAEQEAGQAMVDVVNISALAPFVDFQARGLLQPFHAPEYASYPEGYHDGEGYWMNLGHSAEVIVYNTERVPADLAPKGWEDLTNPAFAEVLAVPDIKGGGTGYLWYYVMRQEFGEDFHRAIGALRPQLFVGTAAMGQAVLSGEAFVAGGILHYTGTGALKADPTAPLAVVWPDPIPLTDLVVGIAHNAPRPNAARAFVDFLASKEGQEAGIASIGIISPRADVATEGVPDLSQFRTISIRAGELEGYFQLEPEYNAEFARYY